MDQLCIVSVVGLASEKLHAPDNHKLELIPGTSAAMSQGSKQASRSAHISSWFERSFVGANFKLIFNVGHMGHDHGHLRPYSTTIMDTPASRGR